MSSRYESITGTIDPDFPEYHQPPGEPMALAEKWVAAAVQGGVREPLALALATGDRQGRTSSRMVAVLDVSADGLLFSTHSTSRKGREIAETGWGSGVLYWRETAQQLSVAGPVEPLDDADNDRLWQARPAALHPMSAVSRQSDPLADPEHLLGESDRLAAAGTVVPRPPRFTGYRLRPDSVEFWLAAETRLHRRLRYERTDAGWQVDKLQP